MTVTVRDSIGALGMRPTANFFAQPTSAALASRGRRQVLSAALAVAAAALLPRPAGAHHGWSGFDTTAPLYLTGTVRQVNWSNPHATLVIELDSAASLPADLRTRSVPAQVTPIDAGAILGKAQLPQHRADRWTVELAPLSRMDAWRVTPPKPGDRVEVVGYTTAGQQGDPVLRAEFLFQGRNAYGLRSAPAS